MFILYCGSSVKSEIHQLFQLVDNENKYVESVSTDWWEKRINYYTERNEEIPDKIVIIDPADEFCKRFMFAIKDGNLSTSMLVICQDMEDK